MITSAELQGPSAALVDRAKPAIELQDINVRFEMPAERIVSFKEYVIRRLTGGLERRELWALRGISFEIRIGEVLGVVGRNGAGKSTLLKVISRVLHPSSGRLVVRGRLAPLLELGAGFHFDLTGRENVFLNAALLGHQRRQVERHFDEVVQFSELQDFIDVPVRNYSSGMLTRLGFSVATMFRPDILLLDEVLAVGDVSFQEKCLERIREYRSRGTTILLVSHQTDDVEKYCDRALWLDHGSISALGEAEDVIRRYLEALSSSSDQHL